MYIAPRQDLGDLRDATAAAAGSEDEGFDTEMLLYILVPVVVVIIALGLSYAFWKRSKCFGQRKMCSGAGCKSRHIESLSSYRAVSRGWFKKSALYHEGCDP